ncbi:putative Protein phosphatase 2A catalytic subunit B [Blattamonas nauphoetae]|uniref:Serine/threonine-protein phosphatase n=1 Tax=Blattamonas nauphoetae TaxID=2049346 RepID=A0ABQ9XRK8_9EUKA|nr:putative Protein phosphatase 2A catalytic subunit B [Blattamonas nauphoetae]
MSLDVDDQIDKVMHGAFLSTPEIIELNKRAKSIFLEESNVLQISGPCTIVGDLHGQLADLIEMFDIAGRAPFTSFLFLGDYVDRGHNSVETVTLLLLLKLRYPHNIHLLRGNHESNQLSKDYSFHTECFQKYPDYHERVRRSFFSTFDTLPLCAVVNERLFCVHGGLSPDIQTIDQIKILNRFQDVPTEGPMADLLWSDPSDTVEGFVGSPRGAGYLFGKDVVNAFLHRNKLTHVIRSHQLCSEGYKMHFFNTVITVWSAPDYCYRMNNIASVLEVDDHCNMFFNMFSKSPVHNRHVGPPKTAVYLNPTDKSQEPPEKPQDPHY